MRTGLRVAITAVVVISTAAIAWSILSNKDDTKLNFKKPATEKARGVKPNAKRQSRSADKEEPQESTQEEVEVHYKDTQNKKVPDAIVENEMTIDEKGDEPNQEEVENHCEDAESKKIPEAIVENKMTIVEKENEPKQEEVESHCENTENEKDNEPKQEEVENPCENTKNEKVPEVIIESETTTDEKDDEPKQEEVENHCENTEKVPQPIVESEMIIDEKDNEPKQEVENHCEDTENKKVPEPIVENETTIDEKDDEPKQEDVKMKLGTGINPNATPFVPGAYKPKKVTMSFSDVLASQKQSRKPTKKSRCTYWPKCSNKNCKFYHPQTQCRSGDGCRFASKCIYLHPSDLASMH